MACRMDFARRFLCRRRRAVILSRFTRRSVPAGFFLRGGKAALQGDAAALPEGFDRVKLCAVFGVRFQFLPANFKKRPRQHPVDPLGEVGEEKDFPGRFKVPGRIPLF